MWTRFQNWRWGIRELAGAAAAVVLVVVVVVVVVAAASATALCSKVCEKMCN